MTIGILAAADSEQARRLERVLEPGRFVRFELGLGPEQPVALDGEGVAWNGVRLERLEALWVHGFRYEDPVLPPAEPAADWGFWQIGPVIRQQSWSFLYSLLSHLERIGGPRLYNPLSTELAAFDRLGQLDRLAAAGFAVPPLLCSNDSAVAAAFQRRHPAVVWRPVTGRAAWQMFRDKQRRHLLGVERPPVLLAAVVPGPLLRAWVLDGRVVLTLAFAAPDREGLERLETGIPVCDLAPEHREALGRAAASLGLRWAMLLFVDGPDGPVIYDADPDPLVTDLPAPFRDHLLAGLGAALSGTTPPELADPEPAARPALLLRRMLAIQFDLEHSKHVD
jgi:hypothetical protein